MLKKTSQLFLLCCILALSLLACRYFSPAARSITNPTSLASEMIDMANAPKIVSQLTCLQNTPGEAECKDCCDNLDTDAVGRKACLSACPKQDFTLNSDFVAINVTSILGPDGDYSKCNSTLGQEACENCCDSSTTFQSGDRRYCRDTCNKQANNRNTNPNPPAQKPVQGYTKTQAALSAVAGQYIFTEGPAADTQGNVYFSDISAGNIYKWSPDGSVDLFRNGLKKPNGMAFNRDGLLIVCEGGMGRIISIDSQGQITPIVEQYNQKRFNEPNDLWIDPQGGIYFTDPVYQSQLVQDGEYVYYINPDRSQVIRVINDLIRPNGIIGTSDGKTLYVADHGASQTFVYAIQGDGMLTNKRLFTSLGSDGMAIDKAGNLYLTTNDTVQVLDASGKSLQEIKIPQPPTNVVFSNTEEDTLFITARSAVYTLQMRVDDQLISNNPSVHSTNSSATEGFILSSPDVVEAGALPVDYSCDGTSATLPLTWSGAPSETKSFAIIMHHVAAVDDTHWYWVMYDIPANVTGLSKNSTGVGTLGTNSVNRNTEYAPPCSKGTGEKSYTYTVYALSTQPQFSVPASQVSRDVLLEAMQDITLASTELHVTYTRK